MTEPAASLDLRSSIEQVRRKSLVTERVGGADVWIEDRGAAQGTTAFIAHDQRLLVIRANVGWRDDVMEALLDPFATVPIDLSADRSLELRPLSVSGFAMTHAAYLGAPGFFLDVAGPQRALRNVTIQAVPVFRTEVEIGESAAKFLEATGSKACGIKVNDWSRSPGLRASVQLLDPWPGGPMRPTPRPWPARPTTVVNALRKLPSAVRLSMLDVFGRSLTVTRNDGLIVGSLNASEGESVLRAPEAEADAVVGALVTGESLARWVG